jgi:hypothetical protein
VRSAFDPLRRYEVESMQVGRVSEYKTSLDINSEKKLPMRMGYLAP